MVGRGEPDHVLLRIDRRDLLVRIGPVPEPVAVQPQVWLVEPSPGPLAGVDQPPLLGTADAVDRMTRLAGHVDNLGKAFVGPARECHRFARKEQFEPFAVGGGKTQVAHTASLQIGLHDGGSRRRLKPPEDRRIGDGLESLHSAAAQEPYHLAIRAAVADRRGG